VLPGPPGEGCPVGSGTGWLVLLQVPLASSVLVLFSLSGGIGVRCTSATLVALGSYVVAAGSSSFCFSSSLAAWISRTAAWVHDFLSGGSVTQGGCASGLLPCGRPMAIACNVARGRLDHCPFGGQEENCFRCGEGYM
jgi:hypothetical protein